MFIGSLVSPQQTRQLSLYPTQSTTIPGYVSAAQTGIDMSTMLPLLIQVMMVALMMKMMSGAMGNVGGEKRKPKPVEAS